MTDEGGIRGGSGERLCLVLGALTLASGIALGAFTTHALKTRLGAAELSWWETGVQYQMWTGLGLVALSARRAMRAPGLMIFAGAVSFCGSLYVMALTGWKALPVVAATPLGGALMIAGWLFAAWRGLRAG